MFVTTEAMPAAGAIGGIAAADEFCRQAALRRGTPTMRASISSGNVTYRAVLSSDGLDVQSRFTERRCLATPDGTVIKFLLLMVFVQLSTRPDSGYCKLIEQLC
jgi:hypothetical protein